VGIPLAAVPAFGAIDIGPVTLSLYWMLLGMILTLVGLQGVFLGCIAQVLFDYTGEATTRWMRRLPYTRTVLIAAGLFIVGAVAALPLAIEYLDRGLELNRSMAPENHLAVFGATAMVSGFSVFVFTLILHGAVLASSRGTRT
jgi:hypothetical protein